MLHKVLATTTVSSGLICVLVEFVIRAQVNRHLAPDERISVHELQWPWVWLGRNGLIARHKRLYPASWLANIFCVLWVLFFAGLIALIAYEKIGSQ